MINAQEINYEGEAFPQIWMGHYNPEHLATQNLSWDFVQKHVDVIEFYINMVAYRVPAEDYQPFIEQLKENDIKIAIQCGYFDWRPQSEDFTTDNPKGIAESVNEHIEKGIGKITAQTEINKLHHLMVAGGKPDYIVLDGPVRRLMNPGADTGRTRFRGDEIGLDSLDDAIIEIIAYMETWREAFPDIRFIPLTNFPNWGWKGEIAYWGSGPGGMFWGDYFDVANKLLDALAATDLPVVGLRADNPYEFIMGTKNLTGTPWENPDVDHSAIDWLGRVRELEVLTREKGFAFDLIVNSDTGGGTSPQLFMEESLRFLETYHNAGGRCERYVFEGWYAHPKEVGPEDKPYTLTNLLREAILRIKHR